MRSDDVVANTVRTISAPRVKRDFVRDVGKQAIGMTALALHRLLGGRCTNPVGILVYHRLAHRVPGLSRPTLNVTPRHFREQLEGLLARGFTVWPLRQVLEYRRAGLAIPPRTLVVTFDDGFESVWHNAWPVLKELRVPATIFVTTAYLDGDVFPFDAWGVAYNHCAPGETYRPLASVQCHEMITEQLVELGAHTHTHDDFRGRPEAFRRDLQASVDILRSRFGYRDVTFAFPVGRAHLGFVSHELTAAARSTGVICGLTTENAAVNPASDPFGWGRFNAFDFDTSATLAAKLEGWYGWAPALQERLTRLRSVGTSREVAEAR